MLFRNYILIILSLLFIVSCKTLPKGVSPHMATWLYGEHTIPAVATQSGSPESFTPILNKGVSQKKIKNLVKPNVKVPAVVYLHGCRGITSESDNYKNLFINKGYAVFMPDSFARPERVNLCGSGDMYLRVPGRQREADTALKEIRKLLWVDQKNVFLVGFNEGGHTAASWYNDKFTAVIAVGMSCVNSGGSPSVPDNVPILTIIGQFDDFRSGESCKVERTIGGSKSVVIKDANHRVSLLEETEEAIDEFLKNCCGL